MSEAKASPSIHVQYGCGSCCPDDWMNFDVSPILRLRNLPLAGKTLVQRLSRFPSNARYGDITKGLPIPGDFADAIYCSHVLEHLWPDECEVALAQTYRHLRSGGVFRLVVPDVRSLARAFLADSDPGAGMRFVSSLHMSHRSRPRGILEAARGLWGRSSHRWMWEYNGLAACLERAGFVGVREAQFGDSPVAAFSSVENADRHEFAVCIEARK